MKTILIILILLIPFSHLLCAEGFLSLGGAGALLIEDPPPLIPDVRLFSGVDFYTPLSNEWSMFLSGTLFQFWRPTTQRLRYLYAAAYDFSWRGADIFIKTGLKAKGEQLYATGMDLPDTFENVFEFHLAGDIGTTTLFLTPQLCYNKEDLIEDNVILSGKSGITFQPGERSVCSVQLNGSFTLIPLHYSTASCGIETGLSLYPDASWFLMITLGALYQASDYTETAAGELVHRINYFQGYTIITFTASLSDNVILKMLLPARFSIKEMSAIINGSTQAYPEWTLGLGPEMELSITLAEAHQLIIFVKGEPFFSNSDYYDVGYGECGLRYQISF